MEGYPPQGVPAPARPITIFQCITTVSESTAIDVLFLFLPANRTLKLWKVISSRVGLAPAYPPPPPNSILATIETEVETLDSRDIWGPQPYTEAGGVLIEGSPLGSWSFTEDTLILFAIQNDHTVNVTVGAVWVISIN
jgi:hypothetical protein